MTGNAPSPLVAHLATVRARVPPGRALVSGTVSLSYGELWQRTDRIGHLLDQTGLTPGDRALIVSADEHEVFLLFMGMVLNGVVAVVVDPGSGPAELAAMMEAADPAAVFIDDALDERNQRAGIACGRARVFRISPTSVRDRSWLSRFRPRRARRGDYADLVQAMPSAAAEPSPIPESTAAYILFTSGTTSRPKGVEITHANLFAQLRTFVDHYGLGDDTHLMNPLFMHHADGLVQGPVLALFAGGRLYRPRRFTVENMPDCADAIYRERITHFVAVPTILALMLRFPGEYDDAFRTPDFRFVCSTAAPLEEGMWSRFEERFGTMVVNSYGLTETVCEGLYCGPDPATRRLGTIGKPVGCEARVVDGSGEAVGRNEVGELILRGANVMRGYFRQPEASAAVLRDGWLHTGDLATVDDDGYFRVVGRIKNMIGRGGFNIYPEDVTRTLLGLDGILDAVTFGLEDPVWGERIVSCVIADGTAPLSVETVFAHCRENLSPEKVPDEVHVFDSLPRGPAGKVVLEQVRDRVRELHRQRAAPAGSDVDSRVLGIAARVFRVPVDTLSQGSTAQTTPGWDSLAHVTLVEEVESEFDIRLGTREMLAIHRLGDVAAMVRERRTGARTAPAGGP